jgi:transcription initiation factor TFIIB
MAYFSMVLEDIPCFHCGKKALVEYGGDQTCRACGTVNQTHCIDDRAEWRTFGDEDDGDDPCRVGYANDYDDMSTLIGDKKLMRLQRMAAQHKPVSAVDVELMDTCHRVLDLPDNVVDIAKRVFRDVKEKMEVAVRGDNLRGLMAAAVFFACRMGNTPRLISQITTAFGVPTNKFNGGCSDILELLTDKHYHKDLIKQSGPNDMLVKMVYSVDKITDKWPVIRRARKLIELVKDDHRFRVQKPSKINATLIYIACHTLKLKVTKQEISEDLGVSIVTMVKHEKVIQDILK